MRYIDFHGVEHERPPGVEQQWRVSCYVVVEDNGNILLVRPVWADRWELPGGGIPERDEETLADGAARECFEETGYTCRPDPSTLQLITENFFCFPRFRRYYHSLTFFVRATIDDSSAPTGTPDPAEIRHVEWVDPAAIDPTDIAPIHWHALQQAGVIKASGRTGR